MPCAFPFTISRDLRPRQIDRRAALSIGGRIGQIGGVARALGDRQLGQRQRAALALLGLLHVAGQPLRQFLVVAIVDVLGQPAARLATTTAPPSAIWVRLPLSRRTLSIRQPASPRYQRAMWPSPLPIPPATWAVALCLIITIVVVWFGPEAEGMPLSASGRL